MRTWFTLAAFVVAATLETGAQPNSPPVRLALIANEPQAVIAADLLTVELSKKERLQLLERTEIERVYHEQGLSAADADDLKLGQLLGADGLLVLEITKQGTNQFLAARLVAVKPGVVIEEIQVGWPMEESSQWAKWMVSEFAPLFPKLSVLAKDAIPISVLNLRSALQTAPNRSLERELTVLLIHRLTREREVFVLERRRMAEALFEKEVGHHEESPFWTGRFLVDGVLDKEGFDPNRLTINARLVSPAGGTTTLIELAGPRTNLVALVDSLVGQVLLALHRSPGTNEWRPLEEAEQYYKEAQWALRWGLKAEARAASESAWALGKRTREVAALRVRSYIEGVPHEFWSSNSRLAEQPPMPDFTKIAPASRALELFCEDTERFACTNLTADADWLKMGWEAVDQTSGLLEGFHRLVEARAGYETQLSQLRSQVRQAAAIIPGNLTVRMSYSMFSAGGGSVYFGPVPWYRFKWDWGGLWYDKPEDALRAWCRDLEEGWRPTGPPRFVAWSWDDRKRLASVQNQLAEFQKGLPQQPIKDHLVRSAKAVLANPSPKTGASPATAASAPIRAIAQVRGATDKPRTVSLTPLQWPDLPEDNSLHPLGFACYRHGRLWCLVYTRALWSPSQRTMPEAWFVGVDLQTARQQVIPLPVEHGRPYGALEVTEDSLYTTAAGRVLRYRFKEQRWESIETPLQEGARVTQLDGRLYLTTQESILEFLPETRTTQVLASARRRPALNPLDSVEGDGEYGYPELFQGAGATIITVVQNRLFSHLVGSTEWKELMLPPFAGACSIHPVVGRDRVLLKITGKGTRERLLELRPDTGGLEALLEHRTSADQPDSRADEALAAPRWPWPGKSELDDSRVATDGQSLWAFVPPGMWEMQQGSEASLLRFEPEFREPLCLRVRLEINGRPYDMSGPVGRGISRPILLVTQAGLVLADVGPYSGRPPGYWLIPQSVLDRRLQVLRMGLPTQGASGKDSAPGKPSPTVDASRTGGLKP